MRVLVIGSGGREHTIAWKIHQSPGLEQLYCAPGNPGTASLGTNVEISSDDLEGLLDFARAEAIDLTVVGPEAPLVDGITDRFRESGKAIVGPSAQAAQLEGSKAFAKDFMSRHAIPTARYSTYDDVSKAESDLRSGQFDFPVVLKADGLAAGKGVLICSSLDESVAALNAIMTEKRFGAAGDRLVIEEFLLGEEASFHVFTDGNRVLPLALSQDHKAIFDGDRGPNTGGMGAYSNESILEPQLRREILSGIVEPSISGMASDGIPFCGILYVGLMLTPQGPQVLEYNVRLGDPETQVILPRLETDLLEVFQALAEGDISGVRLDWDPRSTVCVVVAAPGYPGSYEKGLEIRGLDLATEAGTIVFHAGTSLDDRGRVISSGGRVLGVTARGSSLASATIEAYDAVNKLHFEGMQYRRDIASKGLERGIP